MRRPEKARSLSLTTALAVLLCIQPAALGFRVAYQPLRLAELSQSTQAETEDTESSRTFDCLTAARARCGGWKPARIHNRQTSTGNVCRSWLRSVRTRAISHDVVKHSARQGVSAPLVC